MIRRVLDSLRRQVGEPADRPTRANELRRDAARAERLRREALQAEAAASQPQRPREEPREPEAGRAGHPDGGALLVAALRSRSGLRQAWLVQEVLGPPRALRGPSGHGPEPW